MEVWKIMFLAEMGDGCRFQSLIFQGVTTGVFLKHVDIFLLRSVTK